jgi:hypothetical protein
MQKVCVGFFSYLYLSKSAFEFSSTFYKWKEIVMKHLVLISVTFLWKKYTDIPNIKKSLPKKIIKISVLGSDLRCFLV